MNPLADGFRLDGHNGEAVVLIHGFTGVPAHFRPLGERLAAEGYTVVAPRLAGHGTSVEDMATTGARDWMASATGAIDEIRDHRRVHLAGLSMGGLIAILAAQSTAASTITTINSPVIVHDKRMYATPLLHRLKPTVTYPDTDPPDLDEEMRRYWMPYPGFPTRCAADLVRMIWRALRAARRLERPTLVIQSRTDESVDPRSARILSRMLGRHTHTVWLDHSIHNSLLDRERDAIASAVLERIGKSS